MGYKYVPRIKALFKFVAKLKCKYMLKIKTNDKLKA